MQVPLEVGRARGKGWWGLLERVGQNAYPSIQLALEVLGLVEAIRASSTQAAPHNDPEEEVQNAWSHPQQEEYVADTIAQTHPGHQFTTLQAASGMFSSVKLCLTVSCVSWAHDPPSDIHGVC